MLLTAQRVRSADGRIGVNAFRFMHGSHAAQIDWNALKPNQIEGIFALPAKLDAELIEVAPGGNEVLAFIDVAGPDEVKPQAVVQAVSSTSGLGGAQSGAIGWGVIVNSGRAASLPPDGGLVRVALLQKLLEVLRLPPNPEWRQRAPLQLAMTQWPVGSAWILQLTDESAARVRERLGTGWAKPVVEASAEAVSELKQLDSASLGHALAEAAGVTPELALELGGIELHQEERALLRWPDIAREGFGPCSRCGALNALAKPEGRVGLLCRFCGAQEKSASRWE